ncbi:MAG: hypothetical protein ACFE9D_03320 [Promethearchaeota archaeon]
MERNSIARLLVILGAVLQLIYLVTNGFFGFIIFILVILAAIFAPGDPLRNLAVMTMASMFASSITGFIFMILFFVFASSPGRFRIWLIIIGIFALIIGGIIPTFLAYSLFGLTWPPIWLGLVMTSWLPGLFALIAGFIAQKPLEA